MIFPIGDTQVKGGYKPIVSYTLIVINVVVFAIQLFHPGNLVCDFSVIPTDILHGNNTYTLITSMFLHGGLMHIIGNLLFLWIFADNIEAKIGSFKFLIFYLLGGIIATYGHIYFGSGSGSGSAIGVMGDCCMVCSVGGDACGEVMTPCDGSIPMLGASGAISAVMGAYLVMFPKSQIKILVIFLFRSFYISAWVFLCLWFGQQLISGLGTTIDVTSSSNSGVAWWAHIGGFVFGLLLGAYFKYFGAAYAKPKDYV